MSRLLALCAGVLALATLVPAAWSQETPAPPAPEDPLAQALTAVTSPSSTKLYDLMDARQYLVDHRQAARPLMVPLLGNADILVRMNAAIVLCDMAQVGDTSTATLEALQTAAKDNELAVAYWGFEGLMSDGVPAADQSRVIREMMKMERPRALRLAALTTIGEKKPKVAAPIIISHLQEILKEYTAQVETLVTTAETIQPKGPARPGSPASNVPSPMYAPQPEGPSRHALTSPDMMESSPIPGGGSMGRRGFTPPSPVSTPSESSRLGTSAVEVTQVRRADLPNMTLDQLQPLAQGVEALSIVAEVHQMGLVLEDIVANASPDAPLFDFKTTPPWDLDKCVDKAVIYMNSHRAEYGAASVVPPTASPTTGTAPVTTAATPATTTPASPAPTPAAPPAASPATGTAPATTAATPATTTPAPATPAPATTAQ